MMRIIYVVVLSSVLSGCALTDLNPFDKPQLEVNAALGKNVKQEKAQVKIESNAKSDTTQKADTIRNITQNVPLEFMLLFALLAGWAIPSPSECLRGVMVPFRGLGEWILRLFGRS